PHDQISVMAIDFFTGINAEFLVQRLQVCRKIKIRIDARGGVFRRRHHMDASRHAEPTLFPVKRADAVSILQAHDRYALVRSLRINLGWKMLAAKYTKRSLLHAACDFLKRLAPADSHKILV